MEKYQPSIDKVKSSASAGTTHARVPRDAHSSRLVTTVRLLLLSLCAGVAAILGREKMTPALNRVKEGSTQGTEVLVEGAWATCLLTLRMTTSYRLVAPQDEARVCCASGREVPGHGLDSRDGHVDRRLERRARASRRPSAALESVPERVQDCECEERVATRDRLALEQASLEYVSVAVVRTISGLLQPRPDAVVGMTRCCL